MKHVGILSMQRTINYGSFLQAYALKHLLLENGAESVYFIDVKPGQQFKGYRVFWHKLYRFFELSLKFRVLEKKRDIDHHKKLRNLFKNEYYGLLELDRKYTGRFDLVVIGSDEVFNCCQVCPWGYTTQLYGNIPEADKIVSYAGSFGTTTLDALNRLGVADEVKRYMNNLAAISVRDDNSEAIVEALLNRNAELNLDPVLVYDYSEIINKYEIAHSNYLIIYAYPGRISDRREIAAIKSFAKKHGKRILTIYCRYSWADECVIPRDPFEVLAYFRYADFVITDTFHGTIFSIINQRPFCTLIRASNRQKIAGLMNALGLAFRIAESPDEIELAMSTKINYENVANIIFEHRKKTTTYLREALSKQQKVINS